MTGRGGSPVFSLSSVDSLVGEKVASLLLGGGVSILASHQTSADLLLPGMAEVLTRPPRSLPSMEREEYLHTTGWGGGWGDGSLSSAPVFLYNQLVVGEWGTGYTRHSSPLGVWFCRGDGAIVFSMVFD